MKMVKSCYCIQARIKHAHSFYLGLYILCTKSGMVKGRCLCTVPKPFICKVILPVSSECHGLILEIALSSLVTNGTIERMVDQQKLHDTLSGLFRKVGVCFYAPAFHDRHGAGGNRLGRLLDLNKTHSAVARDRETLVVAESGDLNADHCGGLEECFIQSCLKIAWRNESLKGSSNNQVHHPGTLFL